MNPYNIYVYCDDCFDIHPMPLKVHLAEDSKEPEAVRGCYEARPVPENLAKLARFVIKCPRTGKSFVKKDNARLFLIPSEEREL